MPKRRFQDPPVQTNKNGSYFIRPWIDVIDKDGKLSRQKKTFVLGPASTGVRALKAEKERVLKTANDPGYVIRSQVRFSDLVTQYKKDHLSKLGYAQECKFDWAHTKHLSAFDDTPISEITTLLLQQWFDSKQSSLSKSSRKGLKSILSGIFERAIAWEIYPDGRNPVSRVKIWGDNDAREKRKLTDEQTRAFLAELPYDVRLMSSTCLFCGLRISEALALQEKHLDFERGLILVRQSYYRGVLKPRPKSDKGNRDLPMGYLADDLRRTRKGDPERFAFQIKTAPKFGRETGVCRDDRDLNQHFLRPAAKRLKIYYAGFGFRALRREAITAIGSVAGLGEAANAAGHTHVDTTLIYTLDDLGPREEAIKAFQERILGKPEGGVQ